MRQAGHRAHHLAVLARPGVDSGAASWGVDPVTIEQIMIEIPRRPIIPTVQNGLSFTLAGGAAPPYATPPSPRPSPASGPDDQSSLTAAADHGFARHDQPR